MPTDPDLSCISAAINNDLSVFLPMLFAYIENSVYNKVNEATGNMAALPHLDNRIDINCMPFSGGEYEMA